MIDLSASVEIYTVSQLNRETRFLLEKNFTTLWVEGEISNFSTPSSGHWYFSLKDATAQVRAAMFRPQNRALNWLPADGSHVLLKARVSLYEGRGEFQLLVEHIEDIGLGRLRQAFEALKKKLLEAGLFDSAIKKPLPAFPACIGVITSPTGAAVRDILSVLGRRFPSADVIVYSAQVQGEGAAATLVQALDFANREKKCDVLILARGGGSLEDLWPFNEESVALAIHRSHIPVVSGVGHETDVTIADFVADFRAPTPSVAAESVTPDRQDWLRQLQRMWQQLLRRMQSVMQQCQQQLDWSEKQLQQQHPLRRLDEKRKQLDLLETALSRLQKDKINGLKHALSGASGKLDALSPLSVLQRGYSIAASYPQGVVLRQISDTEKGGRIDVRLRQGHLICTVDELWDA